MFGGPESDMSEEWIGFAAIAWLTGGLVFFALRERKIVALAPGDIPVIPPQFGILTAPIAGLLPSSEAGRRSIQQRLLKAGHYEAGALEDYLALRNAFVLVPLLSGMAAVVWLPETVSVQALVVAGTAASAGSCIPYIIVRRRGQVRERQIRRSLPLLMDSLSLALLAGLSLIDALHQVARQFRRTMPLLAHELHLTHRQAQLGSLDQALHLLAARAQVSQLTSAVFLLTQSNRLGVGATKAMSELANAYRVRMRQEAEAEANRANLYMVFPIVGCLAVSLALLVYGATFLHFAKGMGEVKKKTEEFRSKMEKVERFRLPVPKEGQP